MPRKTDKRGRLVEAAKKMIHQQGFNLTTLADIADASKVPLGNVYYYFKTKEEIGAAVIADMLIELRTRLSEWDATLPVAKRLIAFLDYELQGSSADWTVQYGNCIGALCQELAKQSGGLAEGCVQLLQEVLSWVHKQFQELGLPQDKAQACAISFIAKWQGMLLLTSTFADKSYLTLMTQSMKQEITTWVAGTSPQYARVAEEEAVV
jgi:AcrR family transcriptional regulator